MLPAVDRESGASRCYSSCWRATVGGGEGESSSSRIYAGLRQLIDIDRAAADLQRFLQASVHLMSFEAIVLQPVR